MQYLMLIYDAEADWTKLTPAEQGAMYQEYAQFTREITEGEVPWWQPADAHRVRNYGAHARRQARGH
jgi:hypothetical protein